MSLVDSFHYGITTVNKKNAITYDFTMESNKPWLAKITSICEKYGFNRKFEKCEYRYFHDNDKVKELVYVVEPGFIYEYRNFLVDHNTRTFVSGFFGVSPLGIMELEKEQIRHYLGMPVKAREEIWAQ